MSNATLLEITCHGSYVHYFECCWIFRFIVHVFILFQGVHETPCSDAYLQLEKLVARVVSPYLGILGVYNGNTEPEIRSNFKLPPQIYILGNYSFYIITH